MAVAIPKRCNHASLFFFGKNIEGVKCTKCSKVWYREVTYVGTKRVTTLVSSYFDEL